MTSGNPAATDHVRGQAAFELVMKLEQEATRSFLNQPLFLPGLLQVAAYAAGMIGGIAGLQSGDPALTARVNVRMHRAEAYAKRLQATQPPHLWAVIDEAVLRHAVGGPTVMREQLDHLIAMSELKTVHLGIIPLSRGAHPGLGGSFEVHEAADGEAAVFFEGPNDELVIEQSLVQHYRETAESLYASAVSGAKARDMLKEISSGL
jgi:hypothetical protein